LRARRKRSGEVTLFIEVVRYCNTSSLILDVSHHKAERNFTTVIIKTHLPIGKSGGWRSQLTVEQNDVMDEWINTELDGMDDLKLKYGD